jgi:uncharacterized tellurite resistance protein B-like protein/tRNA U34 5-carboxymethylaminomethyl modifying GTPase MnmE/TrmE
MVAELSSPGSDVAELLSQITEQKIRQESITPRLIFLAALATVLVGVTFADNQVTDEEKQHLLKILNQFIPPGSGMNALVKLMLQGVQKNRIYRKPNELLKLTRSLSESEKLLLLGFGYEISMADGSIAPEEQKYLQAIAKFFSIEPQHLAVLEAGISKQDVDPTALEEVNNLLDPTRFQSLDPIFAHAANTIRSILPVKATHQRNHQPTTVAYKALEKFQKDRKQLDQVCSQFFQITQDCTGRITLFQAIEEEITKLSKKLQSQRFRLAVVGEFSQGKSTLLNALLGEELQPVRAIPCSGTVTILKHGEQKRVICRYKDGREEEIPFDQYQEKASISEQAALCGLSDELARSNIEEIVLEHPNLELCRHNVEIIDSPGLNEHPDRTAVTEKLLQDTDAAIFLANASRPLTQGERDLLQSLRTQLKAGNSDEPADNLFVLVNFMDLLRREKDRQQVRQLVENFVQGQAPIITGETRVHFISAQAALDAILEGTEDEYLAAFQGFTQAIERFLTQERGSIQIRETATKLECLLQESQNALRQSEELLDGNVNLSEAEKQRIMEQIGEASGRDTKIRLLADAIVEQAIEQISNSWDQWADKLGERIAEKSAAWSTQHEEKEKILRAYTDQFIQDLSADLDSWMNTSVKDSILKPCVGDLDKVINYELTTIQSNLKALDSAVGSHLSNQYDLALANMGIDINFNASGNADFSDGEGRLFGGIGLGGGGIVAGALLGFIGLGFLPAILAGGAIGALVGWFFGEDPEVIHAKMKQEVFEKGFEKVSESADEVFNKICENVATAIYERARLASDAIQSSIEILDNLLEQQEKAHQETLQMRESEKQWIHQKYQQLSQVQDALQAILKQSQP